MNEQVRSILAQETTKTSKIRQLFLLGVPRAEIARMVTNGNYGFVVNALRRMREREGGLNIHPATAALDYTFNRKFGIEIEAYNCSRERLARELREAGIEVTVESYNHTTRPHWKLVTDSSINGNDTFELVSPILVGEAGLRELEKVCWVLDLCEVKVNESCGLHVHIDAAGFSMATWRPLRQGCKLIEILNRPQVTIENIAEYVPAFQRELEKATSSDQDRKEEILEAAEILIKYQGYIDRERMIAEKLARLESIKIKGKFDYSTIQSLSTEARQKLAKINPETIAQASRIPGVSPSDINVLLVLSGR